jgi:hypothetical protein
VAALITVSADRRRAASRPAVCYSLTVFTRIEVEPNDNCPMSANLAFKNLADPFIVRRVRVYDGQPGGAMYEVTGWSSDGGGTVVDAWAAQVEDSGAGAAYLVYGGDWGIRLRPSGADGGWDLTDPAQWGETHLVLADKDDLIGGETVNLEPKSAT